MNSAHLLLLLLTMTTTNPSSVVSAGAAVVHHHVQQAVADICICVSSGRKIVTTNRRATVDLAVLTSI